MSLLLAPRYDLEEALPPGVVSYAGATVDDRWRISNDGFTYTAGKVQLASWISPQVGMDQFECMATPLDTTPPSNGTYNEWLDLGQSWTFGWYLTDRHPRDGSFSVQIRRKSDLVVVATFTVEILHEGFTTQ